MRCFAAQNDGGEGESLLPVHFGIVLFVGAGGDVIHPFLIFEVPAHGEFDAFFELERGLPTELVFELSGVDGVAKVMAGAVCDVGDEVIACALGVAQETVYGANEHFNDVNVFPLVKAADVVGVANVTVMENDIDGAGVVHHIKPISHVFSLTVNGEGFAVPNVVDEEGDQFLRELVGAVVIGAVGNEGGHAVSVMISAHKVVACGFGGTIRAVRVVGCGFQKEFAAVGGGSFGRIEFERAVDFIRRDVVEAFALPLSVPILTGGLQQAQRAHDVGAGKGKGVFNGAVHMAFCGKVDDAVYIELLHDGAHAHVVADICLDEGIIGFILYIFEVSQVTGIGEGIEVDDAVLRVFVNEKADDMGADKAGTTGDEDMFHVGF